MELYISDIFWINSSLYIYVYMYNVSLYCLSKSNKTFKENVWHFENLYFSLILSFCFRICLVFFRLIVVDPVNLTQKVTFLYPSKSLMFILLQLINTQRKKFFLEKCNESGTLCLFTKLSYAYVKCTEAQIFDSNRYCSLYYIKDWKRFLLLTCMYFMGCCWVLWHINLCRLFNAKSTFM